MRSLFAIAATGAFAVIAIATAPAFAQQVVGPPLQQVLPDSPLDPNVAGQQVQQAIERSYLRCRLGGEMTVDLLTLNPLTSTAPADAGWTVKATFKPAPAGTAVRPLQPGECAYLDRPPPSDKAVVLWRPLRTLGTPRERDPIGGLLTITTSQQWGYLYTESVDPVFDNIFKALFRGGSPRSDFWFRLRVEPLACARRCTGFVAHPWDFHVLEVVFR